MDETTRRQAFRFAVLCKGPFTGEHGIGLSDLLTGPFEFGRNGLMIRATLVVGRFPTPAQSKLRLRMELEYRTVDTASPLKGVVSVDGESTTTVTLPEDLSRHFPNWPITMTLPPELMHAWLKLIDVDGAFGPRDATLAHYEFQVIAPPPPRPPEARL